MTRSWRPENGFNLISSGLLNSLDEEQQKEIENVYLNIPSMPESEIFYLFKDLLNMRKQFLSPGIEERKKGQAVISEIGYLMEHQKDVDKMLYLMLTGVTVREGLEFNRAFVLLINEHNILKGEMGIGPVSCEELERARDSKMTYRECIAEYGRIKEHLMEIPINKKLKEITIPIRPESGVFAEAVLKRENFNIGNAKEECPQSYDFFQELCAESFAVVPLMHKRKVLGIVVVDRKYDGRPISNYELEFLAVFCSQLAAGIENIRLMDTMKEEGAKSVDALVVHHLSNLEGPLLSRIAEVRKKLEKGTDQYQKLGEAQNALEAARMFIDKMLVVSQRDFLKINNIKVHEAVEEGLLYILSHT